MSTNYQSRLNQIEATLAQIRAETVNVISRLQERQSRIDAVGKSLANLDSQCLDLQYRIEGYLSAPVGSPELPESAGNPRLKTA
jgi:chromosome segregation ATPase